MRYLALFASVMLWAVCAAAAAPDTVTVAVDGDSARPEDRPPHLRPVRRASGPRHLRRHLGRPGFADSRTRAASATTWSRRCGRSRCRTCAGRAAASPTNITGATASARERAVTLNPNWGGVIEPNTFGTHEFMDFVGADRRRGLHLGQRRLGHAAGSGRLAGVHDRAQPTTLAQERAANGHAEPWQVPILGLGNESWGCGGNMTPDYYASQLKIYAASRATSIRSSRKAIRCCASRSARRRRTALHGMDRDGDEGLEGPQVELGHRGHLAALLHGRSTGPRSMRRRASARRSTPRSCRRR